MGLKIYKPTSAGRRGGSGSDFAEITRSTPEKSLLEPLKKTGGRNNLGRMTQRRTGSEPGEPERDQRCPSRGAHDDRERHGSNGEP